MKTFFTSDQHWHHANILNFKDNDGNLIRPGFADVQEMNEYMIERWNSVVDKNDKVYHLGDIIMKTGNWAFDDIIPNLNGNIVLIKGNHDKARLNTYAKHFKDVRSEIHMKTQDGDMVVFTHRPIRISPEEFSYTGRHAFNVHGHIHDKVIGDYKYINVSVERTEYTPVSWDDIQNEISKRKYMMEVSSKEVAPEIADIVNDNFHELVESEE